MKTPFAPTMTASRFVRTPMLTFVKIWKDSGRLLRNSTFSELFIVAAFGPRALLPAASVTTARMIPVKM